MRVLPLLVSKLPSNSRFPEESTLPPPVLLYVTIELSALSVLVDVLIAAEVRPAGTHLELPLSQERKSPVEGLVLPILRI